MVNINSNSNNNNNNNDKDPRIRCLYYDKTNENYYKLQRVSRVNKTDCPLTYNHDYCSHDVLCPANYSCISTWQVGDANKQYLPQLMHSYCMPHQSNCNPKCEPKLKNNKSYYCCCNEQMCNEFPISFDNPEKELVKNITHIDLSPNSNNIPIDSQILSPNSPTTIFVGTSISLLLALISFLIVYKWREARSLARERRILLQELSLPRVTKPNNHNNSKTNKNNVNNKNNNHNSHNNHNNHGNNPNCRNHLHNHHLSQQPEIDLNIQLLELVGSGRFAKVHRAFMSNREEVAVKIITADYRQIFNNELKILKIFRERTHTNVIRFIQSQEVNQQGQQQVAGATGDSKRNNRNSTSKQQEQQEQQQGNGSITQPGPLSLWLVIEFCRYGSLYNFLHTDEGDRVLSWSVCYNLLLGIVNGLTFLHDNNVVHCDFKSKNILLKSNRIPCITDFGHSIMLNDKTFDHPYDQRKRFLQVGTPRYMAPELLDCNVIFKRESFAKIDVYSLGLVMWEVLSRLLLPPYKDSATNMEIPMDEYQTYDIDKENIKLGPYKMPYEDKVAQQPTIAEMRQLVYEERYRPEIKAEWLEDRYIEKVTSCIKDAWEHDEDSRAKCSIIAERLRSLTTKPNQLHRNTTAHIISNSTLADETCFVFNQDSN